MSLESAYRLAGRQLGLNETEQNAALREFMANGGVNLDPATTAWCAAFVNATLNQAGLEGTNSLAARSFESWGQPTETPRPGDLAVFKRGDEDWMGHVGFFHGFDDSGNVLVLGGNQSNSVSIAPYSRNALLGFRTSPGMPGGADEPQGPLDQQANRLRDMPRSMPQPPQMAMLDPQAFMRQPNALAQMRPFETQPYLSRRL